jgi:hypothetical protein
VKRRIGWDKIIFTHVVVIGVPAILYYYLRVGGASLFWLHALVATAYLITALMIIYEATAALFRRYAGSAEEPTGSAERWKRKFKDAFGVSARCRVVRSSWPPTCPTSRTSSSRRSPKSSTTSAGRKLASS